MFRWRQAGPSWPQPDFLPRRSRPPWLAWLWLGCGALALAVAADDWLAVDAQRDEVQRQAQRWAALPRPAAPAAATGGAATAALAAAAEARSAQAAQAVERRLAHRWQALFEGGEGAAASGVRWLRMEHDAERAEVRLEAAAPSRDAILGTLDALAALPGWSDVMLVRVEAAGNSAGAAGGLRFELRARHGAAGGAGAAP